MAGSLSRQTGRAFHQTMVPAPIVRYIRFNSATLYVELVCHDGNTGTVPLVLAGENGEADGTPRAAYGRAGAGQTARSALTGRRDDREVQCQTAQVLYAFPEGHCGTLRDGV
jgi:hypothetical protein